MLIHQGTTFCENVSLELANPVLLQPLALQFPRLRMVIAHLGHPWIAETLVLIRKHRHLYSDISALYYRPWQFYNALVLAMEYGVLDRLLFGTDYPFTTPASTIEALRRVNRLVEGTQPAAHPARPDRSDDPPRRAGPARPRRVVTQRCRCPTRPAVARVDRPVLPPVPPIPNRVRPHAIRYSSIVSSSTSTPRPGAVGTRDEAIDDPERLADHARG